MGGDNDMSELFPSRIKALDSGYNRTITVGYDRSPLNAAPYSRKRSDDRPAFVDVTFRVAGNDSFTLDAFVSTILDGGVKPFEINLPTEAGMARQLARFAAGGVPQLRSVQGNVYTYSARLVIRKWNFIANIVLENGIIDQGINAEWPSA